MTEPNSRYDVQAHKQALKEQTEIRSEYGIGGRAVASNPWMAALAAIGGGALLLGLIVSASSTGSTLSDPSRRGYSSVTR